MTVTMDVLDEKAATAYMRSSFFRVSVQTTQFNRCVWKRAAIDWNWARWASPATSCACVRCRTSLSGLLYSLGCVFGASGRAACEQS